MQLLGYLCVSRVPLLSVCVSVSVCVFGIKPNQAVDKWNI